MSKKMLFINGSVETADQECPAAGAFVVEKGRFTEVIQEDEVQRRVARGDAEIIDLQGKTILPGLIESHGHLFLTGLQQLNLDLRAARNFSEVLGLVQQKAQTLTPGTWIVGEGWNESLWDHPHWPGLREYDELCQAAPFHPIYLTRIDWHAALVNSCAFQMANVSPPQDGAGRPRGLLIDTEMESIQKALPPVSKEILANALTKALDQCGRLGITSFHECGANGQEISVFDEFLAAGQLTCRIHVMVDGTKAPLRDHYLSSPARTLGKDGLLQVRAVKMFADGALGSRGALLFDSYADAQTHGVEIATEDELVAVGERAMRQGYQVATHAIGDRAAHVVLGAYQRVFGSQNPSNLRWRMEHAQMLIPEDVEKMARLGVVASVQCSHCVSDSKWAEARLGRSRLEERSYLWKTLLKAGVKVINGSDTPIEPMGPFVGMHAAITRGGQKGPEVLTRREAFAAMTIDAAWAAFMEHEIGSITVGKRADFVVLDRNPLTCSEEDVAGCIVEETYLAGEKIYYRRSLC